MVPVTSRGTGTTMWSLQDMAGLDFGHEFTQSHVQRHVVLENKGRREQLIKWSNKTRSRGYKNKNRVKLGKELIFDKCSDEMALQVKLAKATRVVKRREAWGAGLLARD